MEDYKNRRNPIRKLKYHTRERNTIRKQNTFQKIILMILIMSVCTAISVLFFRIRMFESNIVMVYLLGILLFSYLAEGYFFSITSSICAVLLYNFFFTEPFFTLKVKNPDYIITFFVMFLVGFITSMLTIRVKMERQQVEEREKYISSLFYIEKKLLDVKSEEELIHISAEELAENMQKNVLIQIYKEDNEVLCNEIQDTGSFEGDEDRAACLETYQSGSPCGHGTSLFSGAKAYYTPIVSHSGVLGVVGISLTDNASLNKTQLTFINVIIPQIAAVLERQNILKKEQRVQMEMQKERLRADMLRSISHDFRTPLAGIMGLSSTARDNYDKINDEVRKNFLQSIYEDADWLNELVENILQTTRFEDGKVQLNIGEEAAEEIISDAVAHVKKHAIKYHFHVIIPDEIILIRVDGILIRQVLVNLLNNAINYNPEDTDITISLYRMNDKAVFEVRDNGTGILPKDLMNIFDRYHHSNNYNLSNRKGMGLGLTLCKTIIEAHNGEISIGNNDPHGTIVIFSVQAEKE
jgi:Osmosensitive K+ channel histidine kinase